MENPEKEIRELQAALLALDRITVSRLFDASGLSTIEFSEEVVVPALERIGVQWEKGEVALSQVYMSGRICEDLLSAHLVANEMEKPPHPPIAIAILLDFHVLGKRLVQSVARAAGYTLTDYGQTDVETLVSLVRADGIRILLVSTLMLSSALQVRRLRERLDEEGLDVRLVVGGVPFRFDRNLWKEVGADASTVSASGVAAILRKMIEEMTCSR